jgi:cyclophilin family peptidyl-prolyl cis-trans isomerase
MKTCLTSSLLAILCLYSGCAQKKGGTDYLVTINTPHGKMVAILYDDTPKHKENFLKLVREKFYDSLLFHRVIEGFMIQGGDPNSRHARPEDNLGNGGPGYTIPAEFVPQHFHERGALAAARLGDQVNPEKASSGSQFYIVQGRKFSQAELTELEQAIHYQRKNIALNQILFKPEYTALRETILRKQQEEDAAWLNAFFEQSDTLIRKVYPDFKRTTFSPAQIQAYTTIGGAPHLDGDYTVFGKVISGLEVIDKIAATEKGPNARPVVDIPMTITVEEMPKSKIEKLYGYTYPDK